MKRCTTLAITFLAACASQPKWMAERPQAIDPAPYSDQDAVVLSRVAKLRFLSGSDPNAGFELRQHHRLQVINAAGRRHARVLVPIDYWTELTAVHARALHPDGSESRLEPGAVTFFSMAGVELYSDNRVAVFDVPGTRVGSIVEYEIHTRSRQGFGIDPWVFDDDVPVRESRLEVEVPDGWEIKWGYTEHGAPARIEPQFSAEDRRLVFEMRDLAAISEEPMGIPPSELARRLQLTVAHAGKPEPFFASWSDVAAWYRNLTADLNVAPEDAKRDLAEFLAADNGGDEREAIYRFVRDRIRYVAVHTGIGALRPHATQAVYGSRLGDCKDMTTLLVALYRARGIEAHPALIGTRLRGVFNPELPSISAFDHAIVAVAVEGRWHFVDPTDKSGIYEQAPWLIQGRTALIVRPDGDLLAQVPMTNAEQNSEVIRWTLPRDEKSPAKLEIRAAGVSAETWRQLTGTAKRDVIDRVLKARYLDHLSGAEVVDARVDALPKGGTAVRATIRVPPVLIAHGARKILPLGNFFGAGEEVRVPAERRSPVNLGPRRMVTEEIVLPIEPSERLARKPKRDRIETALYSYDLATELTGTEARIKRTTIFREERVEPNRISELRDFAELLATDVREALIIQGAR